MNKQNNQIIREVAAYLNSRLESQAYGKMLLSVLEPEPPAASPDPITIILSKCDGDDLSVESCPDHCIITLRDYTETWMENIRENVASGAEDADALEQIKTDEYGNEYVEFDLVWPTSPPPEQEN